MEKTLQTFCILAFSLSFAGCAGANPNSDNENFVAPMGINEIDYEAPQKVDDSTQSRTLCATGGAKAVQNYNAFARYSKETKSMNLSIIGDEKFISYAWCHEDVKNPEQFVVGLVTVSKRQWKADQEKGTRTHGSTIYTIFDKDMNITKWSLSGVERVKDSQ